MPSLTKVKNVVQTAQLNTTTPKMRGRPAGSKNKPKAYTPVTEVMPSVKKIMRTYYTFACACQSVETELKNSKFSCRNCGKTAELKSTRRALSE